MTTGIILAVILLILLANVFLKKTKSVKARKVVGTLHKILGIALLVMIGVHLVLTLPLIKQRPIAMYILGFVMLACAIAEVVVFLGRKKLKGNWIHLHRIFAIMLLLCMLAHVVFGIGSLQSYQKRIAQVEVTNVDVSQIADGSYIGEYDAGYVYAKVEVTVKDGKIDKVELLEHRTERGQKAEVLPARMVEEQQVDVDTVSSATNSSKAIKQAVYNALTEEK